MRLGRRNRSPGHDIPALAPAPAVADLPKPKLQAGARYFGTTADGERVVARGLGARSTARISLSAEGLDVIRLAGSFRIPAEALRGARHDHSIAGKAAPGGLLMVTWQHGDCLLDTGFRLSDVPTDKGTTEADNVWVRSISKIAKEHSS